MTMGGWLLMGLFWGLTIGLNLYCYVKVMAARNKQKETL